MPSTGKLGNVNTCVKNLWDYPILVGFWQSNCSCIMEKRKKERPCLEPDVDHIKETHAGNTKLARALGSPDYHTREKAVAAMTRFLQRKTGLRERDMLKIWKGLFYAFWHSDKVPVQVRKVPPPKILTTQTFSTSNSPHVD